jgi:hypothetical protein
MKNVCIWKKKYFYESATLSSFDVCLIYVCSSTPHSTSLIMIFILVSTVPRIWFMKDAVSLCTLKWMGWDLFPCYRSHYKYSQFQSKLAFFFLVTVWSMAQYHSHISCKGRSFLLCFFIRHTQSHSFPLLQVSSSVYELLGQTLGTPLISAFSSWERIRPLTSYTPISYGHCGITPTTLNVRGSLWKVAGTGRMKTIVVLDGMKSSAVPDWMKSGAVSTGRQSGRFVLVTVTWRKHSRSPLAGACSFLMQVGRPVLTRSLSK